MSIGSSYAQETNKIDVQCIKILNTNSEDINHYSYNSKHYVPKPADFNFFPTFLKPASRIVLVLLYTSLRISYVSVAFETFSTCTSLHKPWL